MIANYTTKEKVRCENCHYEDEVEVTRESDVIILFSKPIIKAKYNSSFFGLINKSWKYCPKCENKTMELKEKKVFYR